MSRVVKNCVLVILLANAVGYLSSGMATAETTLRLNLDKCVEMAVEVNIQVLQAGYDLDRAKNAVMISSSSLIPYLRFQSTHSWFEQPYYRYIGDRSFLTDQAYNASLTVGETITFDGIMGVFESSASKRATEHYVKQVRQDISFVAKQKYLEVLKAERLLGVREEAVDLSERRLEKAEALVEVGSAVRSDVLRARVEVSMNELELISARNDLRLAETDLRHFLELDDEVELELEDNLEMGEVDFGLDAAISEAMQLRPDIRSAGENLASVRHSVWRERGGWFPYIDLRWTDNYTSNKFPDKIVDLERAADWSLYLTVGIDLFDGLRTFGRVRDAKSMRKLVEKDLLQVEKDAALEVKQAFYSVEEARQRVKVSRETVSLAEEELRLAEERYRLGGGTMLEQIDSQVALSEARTSHIEALYDYLISQAMLAKAMGKD